MSSRRTHDRSSKRTRELMAEVRVASLADLAPGQPVRAEAAGAAIVLARVGDQVFACGNTCAPRAARLPAAGPRARGSPGPCQGGLYDVGTGESSSPVPGLGSP